LNKVYTGQKIFTGKSILNNFRMEVEDGFITSLIGDQNDVDSGYVIPGIIDSHCHLMLPEDKHVYDNHRGQSQAVLSGYGHAFEMLKGGVVACRDLGSKYGYVLGIKDIIDQKVLIGPKIISAGQSISVTGGHGFEMSLECDGKDEISKGVKIVIKEGADLVKLMASGGVNSPGEEPGPPELTLEELKIATDTAHAFGRKVSVHAHGYTAMKRAIEAGVDSIEHGVYLEEDLMNQMIEKDIYLVPTFSAPYYAVKEGLKRDPNHSDHNESKLVLERHRKAVLKAYRKGVKVAFGTDAGTPFNPYDDVLYELVLMVEAGFTEAEAITCGTVNSADLLDLKHMGELKVGKEANFIVLENDPLEDIRVVMTSKKIYLKGELIEGD